MRCVFLKLFLKKLDTYTEDEQTKINDTIEEIKNYVEDGKAPYGLRIKRLSSRIFEGRINIHLRIAYFKDKDIVKFFCLGNHNDIRKCLRWVARQ